MRSRLLSVFILLLSVGTGASAQTATSDQLNQLKNLTPEEQQQLMQGLSGGKTDSSGKKVDQKLSTPQTVQPM